MGGVELIFRERPPSVNNRTGKQRDVFRTELAREFQKLGSPRYLDGILFGLVTIFVREYRPATDPDADNLSKAVWDGLQATRAFRDDKQIRVRTAAIIDLREELVELDLLGLPDFAVDEVNALLAKPAGVRDWLTFVRYGKLDVTMLQLALSIGRT